jgi:hypothetical protein
MTDHRDDTGITPIFLSCAELVAERFCAAIVSRPLYKEKCQAIDLTEIPTPPFLDSFSASVLPCAEV